MYRIFSVGYLFPGGDIEVLPFESKQSLLDADVIVFEPTLGHIWSTDTYQGKPSLSEGYSFQVREGLAHWRRELKEALDAGKVIFVFLAQPREVFVDTGRREYSGTGRNQKVTRIVERASSYESLPLTLNVYPRTGQSIVAAGDLGFLASYWAEFEELSGYEVTIEGKFTRELLKVRGGTATVGAAVIGRLGRAFNY